MPSSLAFRLALLVAIPGFAVTAGGCASTATVSRLKPAEAEILGVSRLAVPPIEVPEEHRASIQQALLESLSETGKYQVVDMDQLQRFAPGPILRADGAIDRRVAIEAARRASADAVLISRIQIAEEGWADMGSVRMIVGDPTIRAICDLRLIEVRSGRTLFEGSEERTYRGELSNSRSSSTSRPRVFGRLARECTIAATRKVTPHEVRSDVELPQVLLGKGSGPLRRGNSLAREGRWDEAQQEWLAALSEAPENDVAVYSVGLAHEAKGEFPHAEQRYRQAAEIADKPLYQEALQRVQQASYEHRLAWEQLTTKQAPTFAGFDPQARFEHVARYEAPETRRLVSPEPIRRLAPVDAGSAYESRLPPPLGNTTSKPFYR